LARPLELEKRICDFKSAMNNDYIITVLISLVDERLPKQWSSVDAALN
jgi:hypothetical protein